MFKFLLNPWIVFLLMLSFMFGWLYMDLQPKIVEYKQSNENRTAIALKNAGLDYQAYTPPPKEGENK